MKALDCVTDTELLDGIEDLEYAADYRRWLLDGTSDKADDIRLLATCKELEEMKEEATERGLTLLPHVPDPMRYLETVE